MDSINNSHIRKQKNRFMDKEIINLCNQSEQGRGRGVISLNMFCNGKLRFYGECDLWGKLYQENLILTIVRNLSIFLFIIWNFLMEFYGIFLFIIF